MERVTRLCHLIGVAALLVGPPAVAQVRQNQVTPAIADSSDGEQSVPQQPSQTPFDTNQAGQTARSSVGQVGQRQTRETESNSTGLKPMARISSRISNRVQNRIRNRIDRNYDPQTGAADPFAAAEDRSRADGRPR